MATKVHMEALSPTMEEGTLVQWLKNEGDEVTEGDVIAEIETDKATMELVARGSGTLNSISLKAGETAPVGTVIAMIGGEGGAAADDAEADDAEADDAADGGDAEDVDDAEADDADDDARGGEAADGRDADDADDGRDADDADDDARGGEEADGRDADDAGSGDEPRRPAAAKRDAGERGDGRRVKASPLARRLASESGLELGDIEGTGPGGRITKRDIEAAAKAAKRQRPAATQERAAAGVAPTQPARFDGPDVEEVPVSQMRKAIAKRLVQSIGPIPTFYLTMEVDMARVTEARERVNARLEQHGMKASVNDFIIRATAAALRRHPEVNASWQESVIQRHNRVHIGVAVAIEDGLITPIIRDADRKGLGEISQEVRELAGRAREKRLKPEEYTGATFSISNLGMFGIDEFTAIINPPEAAILAIGRVEEKVFVEDGELVAGPRMRVTMSCDHRVIDGATGARFLQTLREFLEEPVMILA
jgi:pyruvate dehydrogenase E2 component (dihydrolipoamide acetyltransferase)